jgi:hypothetical protein
LDWNGNTAQPCSWQSNLTPSLHSRHWINGWNIIMCQTRRVYHSIKPVEVSTGKL